MKYIDYFFGLNNSWESWQKSGIVTTVNREWLAKHPLTDFSLHAEEDEWRKVGMQFEVVTV